MKETRLTIFHKIGLCIMLLLVPIVLLYGYSNRVSESVVRTEMRNSLISRLTDLQNRLSTQIILISKSALQLSSDPSLSEVNWLESFKSLYNIIQFKKELMERIAVQNSTMEWPSDISIYFPPSEQVITTGTEIAFDTDYLRKRVNKVWKAWPRSQKEGGGYDIVYYAISPFSAYADPLHANNIVEIRVSGDSLVRMLDEYKVAGKSDPFLYDGRDRMIASSTVNLPLTLQVRLKLKGRPAKKQNSFQTEIDGHTYLVNSIGVPVLGWTLVDYLPMEQVLLPIKKSNTLFYASTSLLLIMSLIAAFLLYRNVQIPIKYLIHNLQRIKRGDYSARIDIRSSSEFQFVFQRFNEMSAQIGDLIENVYHEQLTARDAQLKQMQSQINPHFLYNCLYFIVNMVRLGSDEAAERMAVNLGDYFKYTTRLEKQDARLREEIELIRNYLEIQNLRMRRIGYEIDIPESMMELEIPRLLLQPVVENAVIHGIEPKLGGGVISITGSRTELQARIAVEDSGVGMTEVELAEWDRRLAEPVVASGSGYGVWNVNQRLLLKFGAGSGLSCQQVESGGLRVILTWNIPTDKPEEV